MSLSRLITPVPAAMSLCSWAHWELVKEAERDTQGRSSCPPASAVAVIVGTCIGPSRPCTPCPFSDPSLDLFVTDYPSLFFPDSWPSSQTLTTVSESVWICLSGHYSFLTRGTTTHTNWMSAHWLDFTSSSEPSGPSLSAVSCCSHPLLTSARISFTTICTQT